MYLGAEEGVSFKTDNQMYLCSCCNGMTYYIHCREVKEYSSKFQVILVKNNKILLKDFRDMYVSLVRLRAVTCLEAEKTDPDEHCEFEVFSDGERVILKASNGLFVCRTFKRRGDFIEASKNSIEDCCGLHMDMGDVYLPCYDIISVTLHDVAKLVCRPYTVKKEICSNKTDEPKNHSVTLSWDIRTTETTLWETTWGINSQTTATAAIMASEATIRYNGSCQKIASVNRQILEKRSATVEIPAHYRVVFSLVVSKIDTASVPFTAYIVKTKVSGEKVDMEEKGVWKGLVYDNITLETKIEREPNYRVPWKTQ